MNLRAARHTIVQHQVAFRKVPKPAVSDVHQHDRVKAKLASLTFRRGSAGSRSLDSQKNWRSNPSSCRDDQHAGH